MRPPRQTCAGQRFWDVDNQPVRVGHSLSASGNGYGGGNLDVKIMIAAGDSNVANGRNLFARLNWNAVQLRVTDKQNRTDGYRFQCQGEPKESTK